MSSIPKKLTILLVDDDTFQLHIIKSMLDEFNHQLRKHTRSEELFQYSCVTATNGVDALRVAEENRKIDLALLDMILPDMGGIELIHSLHTILGHKVPCVMISAVDEVDTAQKCIFAGAFSYVVKPLQLIQLSSICQYIICRHVTDQKDMELAEMKLLVLETERRKDREAVDMLSHEHKNKYQGAKAMLGGVLERCRELQVPIEIVSALQSVEQVMHVGYMSCFNQAMMLQIAHEEYVPQPDIGTLLDRLSCAMGTHVDVRVDAMLPTVMELDWRLLGVVLGNAVSNARKYGGCEWESYLTVSIVGKGAAAFVMHNAPCARHTELRELYGQDCYALLQKGVRHASQNVHSTKDAMACGNGNGNGLWAAYKCAKLMGGTLVLRFLPDRVCLELVVNYTRASFTQWDLPPGSTVAVLDDDPFMRFTYRAICRRLVGDGSYTLVGCTYAEIQDFPELVLETNPTVVIVDQHLDDPEGKGRPPIKGTDIIKVMRTGGYLGCVVMRSGNNTAMDVTEYTHAGADLCISKAVTHPDDIKQQLHAVMNDHAFLERTAVANQA